MFNEEHSHLSLPSQSWEQNKLQSCFHFSFNKFPMNELSCCGIKAISAIYIRFNILLFNGYASTLVNVCEILTNMDAFYFVAYYSTGVQIVSCTLSDDSVLSGSTGLFNPVLCVSQWISFDKKISQWDCVFQIRLGLQENDSPLHLVTSSGFLKA